MDKAISESPLYRLSRATRSARQSLLVRTIIGLALASGAVLVVALLIDVAQLRSAIGTLGNRPDLVAAFLAAYSFAFWLRALAWRVLLTRRLRLVSLFSILQGTLVANHALPFGLGEATRPLLATRHGVPIAEAATSTAVARTLDFVALIAIATAAGTLLAFPEGRSQWLQGLILPALVAIAGGAVLLLLRSWTAPGLGGARLRSVLATLQAQLRQLSMLRLLRAALWTLPSWMLEAVVLLVAAEALGVGLSVVAAIGVTAFTILFQAFRVTPGGIGIYEASMSGALVALGMPLEQALVLAVVTHGLKFAYAFSVGLAFAVWAARESLRWLNPMKAFRGSAAGDKHASGFEIVAARAWNVINEGKPFTVVFLLGVVTLLGLWHLTDAGYWLRTGVALAALVPLLVVFYRFDFPLRLRWALWAYLALFLVAFRFVDVVTLALVVGVYLTFTIFVWGTVYYHLRIGTSWLNFTRFWRLVLENPDPTSGNFLEQIPKLAMLALGFQMLVERPAVGTFIGLEAFALGVGVTGLLLHQWFFKWPPAPSLVPTRLRTSGQRISRRFVVIVIDGCRADRLLEADTPFIDRIRREGIDYVDTSTVYPARTVTGFSSMFTGAPPRVHGMRSNFVPSLGVKCESIFDALRSAGMKGKLVGIAHLVDAFGSDVETVTAVTNNDDIDHALAARARAIIERDDPDLLVLQLLSVDQTGHARGSYNSEYLAKIEASDRIIEDFLGWCEEVGYLENATVLIIADHGQGIGIGGHGHMSKPEIHVPCIMWGHGIASSLLGNQDDSPRSVMDVAPTIAYFLGAPPPAESVGQVLGVHEDPAHSGPVAVVVPVHNEAENLPATLAAMPRHQVPGMHIIVVDDGSTDGSAEVARRHGADTVVSHERNRGLGAALRTGLEAARSLDARAAVYIDADGEYPPEQIPDLLAPIESGEADYVLGSRYTGTREGQRLSRLIGNLVFTAVLCIAAGRIITDGQTGFRAFSRRALGCAEIIHDYNYAQVLTLDLLKKGMRLHEVPVTYRVRSKGKSFISPQYLWRVPQAMLREMLSS